jgi:hypothetical protein
MWTDVATCSAVHMSNGSAWYGESNMGCSNLGCSFPGIMCCRYIGRSKSKKR